jgi:hypothetical protein
VPSPHRPRLPLRQATIRRSGSSPVTLAPADQATLDAPHPSAYQLCAAAQHALGLAAFGSQIDPAQCRVMVRDGSGPRLAFVDEATLWWVANVSPAALGACVDHVVAHIAQGVAAHDPSS